MNKDINKIKENFSNLRNKFIETAKHSNFGGFYSGSLFILSLIESEWIADKEIKVNLKDIKELESFIYEIVDKEELYLFIAEQYIRK